MEKKTTIEIKNANEWRLFRKEAKKSGIILADALMHAINEWRRGRRRRKCASVPDGDAGRN